MFEKVTMFEKAAIGGTGVNPGQGKASAIFMMTDQLTKTLDLSIQPRSFH
jgi:hypothetical protein